MTEETKKEQIQNEEFKEKEEITTQHINEFIDTYLKIKKLYARYKSLKKNIIDEVGEGEYISQERPNDATIHIHGLSRIPSTIGNSPENTISTSSETYYTVNTQITKTFKHFEKLRYKMDEIFLQ